VAQDRARSDDRDRPAGGRSQARAVHRCAFFSGARQGRIHSEALEVKLSRLAIWLRANEEACEICAAVPFVASAASEARNSSRCKAHRRSKLNHTGIYSCAWSGLMVRRGI